jgi:protein SCO1/2
VPRTLLRPVALLVAALLLAACGGSGDASAPAPFSGQRLDPPFEVEDRPLTDTTGAPYSLVRDTDKPLTLVFFGYTHCPDICGIVMSTLASAMTRLDDADRDRVDVVFVTTDPARDTTDVLDGFVTHFDESFTGLTGDLADIVEVAEPLGVGVEHGTELPSGGYDVTHGTQVIGIDGHDQAPVYWSQDVSAAQLAADVHQLLGEE